MILLQTETQRGIQKSSGGRSQVLFWNKNKTRARIVFSRPRSLKERCTRSMEKPHMVSQDRDKEDDISVSVFLCSDLQHSAVKRVLLL